MFFRHGAAHEQQAVHLLLQQRVDDANFFIFLLIRVAQNNVVVVHIGDIFDSPRHFREDRIRNIGNDDADGRRLLARKSARNRIRAIAEPFDRFEYFLARLRFYVRDYC